MVDLVKRLAWDRDINQKGTGENKQLRMRNSK